MKDDNIKVLNILTGKCDDKTIIYTVHTREDNVASFAIPTWNRDVKPKYGCDFDAHSPSIIYDNHDQCRHAQRVWNEVAHPWINRGIAVFNKNISSDTIFKWFDRIYDTFDNPNRIQLRLDLMRDMIHECKPEISDGYVYLMRITDGEDSRLKIGMTTRPVMERWVEIAMQYMHTGYTVSIVDEKRCKYSLVAEGVLQLNCSAYKADPIIKKEDSTKAAYDSYNSELFKDDPKVKEIWDNYWAHK